MPNSTLSPAIDNQYAVLARLEETRALLAAASSVDEVRTIRDRAEALRYAARAASAGLDIQNKCAEIKIRAERRAGELLAESPKQHGARPADTELHGATPPTYREIGIEKTEAHRWQRIADLPQDLFEEHIAAVQERGEELTTAGVLRLAKEREREGRREENRELVRSTPPATITTASGQRFQTIALDPPWDWGDEGDVDHFGRGRPTYATMPIDSLHELPIGDLAAENAHLYLWITNRSLPKGFALLESWGFRYVTMLTWVKPSIGMGNYYRGSTEHVLFGVRGSLPLLRRDVGTHFAAPRPGRHSEKPEAFYELVESCSPGPWLEMFSREERQGWVAWGAEVSSAA